MDFQAAGFLGAAYFDGLTWPAEFHHSEAAFREALFDRFADFSQPNFKNFSAFDGAVFKGEMRFASDSFSHDVGFREALRLACLEGSHDALGHGLRSLKQAAEAVRDRSSEQTFFRYEVIARRHHPQTAMGDRCLSWSYGLVSDYGDSIVRPLVAAFVVWIVGAMLYLLLGAATFPSVSAGISLWRPIHPAMFEAFQLSARSIFSLFGVWNIRQPDLNACKGSREQIETLLLWKDPAVALSTRLISSAQSIISGALLFLSALAVRRRFQIS